ncbi:MAG: ATPase [Candidatus Margulisbacteria bacterium GWF2_35_9]|nr:MAG: ATPase [Candidatus Margulisbacteria bacterium GWF2_35_9]
MFKRALSLPLEEKSSLFLFGPRGTGKTSWLKTIKQQALYLDLLDFSVYEKLSASPDRLRTFIVSPNTQWVIIDEVQRVPELLQEVHRLIESQKIRFILTGSSARSLRKKGVNLLAGRALTFYMHPLIPSELGDAFSLERALTYGLLPSVITHENPQKYLESYVQTYVKEEVMQEGLTRNIGTFNKFLEVASFSQGNIINSAEVARELGVSRSTVVDYFQILEDLLLAVRINPFSQRAKRKIIAHPKFYFFDTGVFRVLRPKGPLDTPEEIDGAALETLILQVLRAVNDYHELGYTISFWRTATGHEVDFILYGPAGFYAIEIKRSAKVSMSMLKGLKAFKKDYEQASCLVVYMGQHHQEIDGIRLVPCNDFLLHILDFIGNKK